MSTSNRLFGRQYLVTLVPPDGLTSGIAAYGNVSFDESLPASALRVEFDISKDSRDQPNKGVVSITNMSSINRARVAPGLQVILTAGYQDIVEVLFNARVCIVKTERQGPDITTALELIDGDAAISNVQFQGAYKGKVPAKQVIEDCILQMGDPLPPFYPNGIQRGHITGLPPIDVTVDKAPSGTLHTVMSDLCRNYGLEWSIQDGILQVNPLWEHLGDCGEVISPATGMIGVPSWDGSMLVVKTLLNPRLQPGKMVQVVSKDLPVAKDGNPGTYKIRGGHWRGDSHGDDWSVELECIPIPRASADLTNQLGQNAKDLAKKAKARAKSLKKSKGHITVHMGNITVKSEDLK